MLGMRSRNYSCFSIRARFSSLKDTISDLAPRPGVAPSSCWLCMAAYMGQTTTEVLVERYPMHALHSWRWRCGRRFKNKGGSQIKEGWLVGFVGF